MNAIENFISKVATIATKQGYLVDPEKLTQRYVGFLHQSTKFEDINFDYLTVNYDRRPIFDADNWSEVTEVTHRHILNLCYFAVKDFRYGMGEALFPDGIQNDHLSEIWREVWPNAAVAEDFFPFPAVREVQRGILAKVEEYLNNPDITDIIIDAPTGVGKSGIAIALLLRFGAGYLGTANKNLQNQYTSEFPWLADLRGRANYNCNVYPGSNCKNSPCQNSTKKKKECSQAKECDYHKAQANAFLRHNFTLMNMHTLVAYAMFAEGLVQKREVLIIDEAHSFPEVISSSVGMTIPLRKLAKYGIREIPKYDSAEYYREWLNELLHRVSEFIEGEVEDEEKLADEEDDAGFHHKILFCLKELNSDNLAIDHEMDVTNPSSVATLKMHPIRVEEYYKKICAKAPLRIHLSATILAYDTYCDMLGIKRENVGIMRAGCPFPKENRPIMLSHGVGYISRGNLEHCLPDMVKNIMSIMDHYPDYKGIIHGATYFICNNIYNQLPSKYKARVLYARTAKEQAEMLFKHKNSKNTVLLSPSMTEGVDLKDDMSRFQILAKVPYPYLGDPLIQKRKELFKGYYEMLTAITLLQAYGRSVRNERDWCHTYVLDKNFGMFVKSNWQLFPGWFTDAIHW